MVHGIPPEGSTRDLKERNVPKAVECRFRRSPVGGGLPPVDLRDLVRIADKVVDLHILPLFTSGKPGVTCHHYEQELWQKQLQLAARIIQQSFRRKCIVPANWYPGGRRQ